ncbi:MAG: hypothetical protein V6Z81_10880, partial [Parvularculales bacterium]
RIAFKLNRNTAPTFYFISITLIVLGSLRIGLCSSQTARGGTRLVREAILSQSTHARPILCNTMDDHPITTIAIENKINSIKPQLCGWVDKS